MNKKLSTSPELHVLTITYNLVLKIINSNIEKRNSNPTCRLHAESIKIRYAEKQANKMNDRHYPKQDVRLHHQTTSNLPQAIYKPI